MRGVKVIVENVNVDLVKHVRIALGNRHVSTFMEQIHMCANVEILKHRVTKKQNVATNIMVSVWRVRSKKQTIIGAKCFFLILKMKEEC